MAAKVKFGWEQKSDLVTRLSYVGRTGAEGSKPRFASWKCKLPQHNTLNSSHTRSKLLIRLFPVLFLSPSKVQSLLIITFHQFQLILAHCKALDVPISATSYLYLFHGEFAFDYLIRIAKSSTTGDFTKPRLRILLISLLGCYFLFLFFSKFAKNNLVASKLGL